MPSDNSDRDPDAGRDPGPERGRGPDSGDSSPPDSSPPTDSSNPSNPSGPPDPSGPPGATSPSDSPLPDDSRSFTDRIEEGWERALDHLPLAAVPLVASLLAVDNVRRVLGFREDFHLGVTFRFPSALPDLWTFVSLPNQGPGIHVSPTLFVLPVLIPVQAALVAGLVGSVHEAARTGEYDFAANARRYFVPLLVYVALVRIAGLAAFSVGAVALPLLLVLFPAFILLSYLFYATPYLLVVADSGVEEAFSRSYEWALDGGPYFSYGAGYLLFVAAVSLVGTLLVVNLGALGVLIGAFAAAPVALALTFATTEFVAEMAGGDASGGSGGVGGSDDGGVGGGGSSVGEAGDSSVGEAGDSSVGGSGVGDSSVGGSGVGDSSDGGSGVGSRDVGGTGGDGVQDGDAGPGTDASAEENDDALADENSDQTHGSDAQIDSDRGADSSRETDPNRQTDADSREEP